LIANGIDLIASVPRPSCLHLSCSMIDNDELEQLRLYVAGRTFGRPTVPVVRDLNSAAMVTAVGGTTETSVSAETAVPPPATAEPTANASFAVSSAVVNMNEGDSDTDSEAGGCLPSDAASGSDDDDDEDDSYRGYSSSSAGDDGEGYESSHGSETRRAAAAVSSSESGPGSAVDSDGSDSVGGDTDISGDELKALLEDATDAVLLAGKRKRSHPTT
jgi:hypothetical protein